MTAPVPIFIITHNRLEVLMKTLKSFENFTTPHEIVIHDNSSTFVPLVDFLKKGAYRVYWNKGNELNDVAESISTYFEETKSSSEYYVVTDPDIEMTKETPTDMLEMYMFLLNSHPSVTAVGPELKVDDIPDCYPLKNDLLRKHKIGHRNDKVTEWKWKDSVQKGAFRPLDTTFGMYRRSFVFKRLNPALLTWYPYNARHLDWYIDPREMKEDQIFYMKDSSNKWGHWGSSMLSKKIGTDVL